VPAPAPPVPQSRASLQAAEPAVKPRVSVLEKKSLDKFLRMASCNSASLLDLNQRQEATKPVEMAGIPLSKSTLLMHKEEINNNNSNINSDSNQKSNQKNNNNSQLRSGTLSYLFRLVARHLHSKILKGLRLGLSRDVLEKKSLGGRDFFQCRRAPTHEIFFWVGA